MVATRWYITIVNIKVKMNLCLVAYLNRCRATAVYHTQRRAMYGWVRDNNTISPEDHLSLPWWWWMTGVVVSNLFVVGCSCFVPPSFGSSCLQNGFKRATVSKLLLVPLAKLLPRQNDTCHISVIQCHSITCCRLFSSRFCFFPRKICPLNIHLDKEDVSSRVEESPVEKFKNLEIVGHPHHRTHRNNVSGTNCPLREDHHWRSPPSTNPVDTPSFEKLATIDRKKSTSLFYSHYLHPDL